MVELVKIAALAALAGLVAARWLSPLDSATVAAAVLYLLLVRVSRPPPAAG